MMILFLNKAMMFSAILMFFIFTLIEAGLKRDRFEVRENTDFEMECNHGLENITRIRWEYIASQEKKSEIIYDSQTSAPKIGFEVFCQPHQTFISKCTLKLMQAKKDDSGKYICFIVEESETNFDSHLLKSIIEIELVITGVNKERYVLRENSPVEMDCNGELENVTRVTWEFISTHDIENGNEIIYDSQSDKELKNGFEISCQPHQTFISKCTLTLVQARKEDSGKYICYVGVASETKFDSNLEPIGETELVIRGPINKTMVANQGNLVILPCEHNIKNITRTRWSHVSLQGVMIYNLYYMNGKETTHDNYEGDCGHHQPSCNLKILQANKESAGRYICMVGESLEFEEKYGLDQMTYFIEIELVVGELFCNENMKKDLTLIGENDCYGIEADVLNLKCSFNYFGNINYNILHLSWIEKYKFNSLEKKLNSSLINHEVKDETNKISIRTNLSVAYEMQNSIFQCVLEDTLVKPCQLHEFRTQYMKNTTKRSPSIHSNDLHDMKCSANKSENVQCSYYLVHEISGSIVDYPLDLVTVQNINSPGNYTCIAKCLVGEHKDCIIKAMEFEVVQESCLPNLNIGLIAALIVIIFILFAIILTLVLKRRCVKSRRKDVTERLETAGLIEKSSSPLDVKQAHVERTPKHDVQNKKPELLREKIIMEQEDQCVSPRYSSHSASLSKDAGNTNSKRPGNKNSIEPENPSASPPLSSDSAPITKRATKIIENSSSPLEVKETLVERTSKRRDIVIYESMNIYHSIVLMIDEAIWDTSFIGSSTLETKIFNMLECLPKPKKVLVIGRCEGRIVRELIRRVVESVDVYDIGESGPGQAKELYNLYCKYFPKLAIYLQHRKVSYIDGGIDFLKNQQNVFDVIIIRSSWKSPYRYLFTYEYLDSVKSALKEGGIAVFIVSGQSVEETKGSGDFVEHDVQLLCKQLFPMVKYFQFHSFSNIDHPSCLTRVLLCGLNQGKDLEEL